MSVTEHYIKSGFLLLIRQNILIYLVIIISGIGLAGWVTEEPGLSSFISVEFFPIPQLSSMIFITLGILYLIHLKNKFQKLTSVSFLTFIAILCLYLFLNYFFHLTEDIERVFIRYPLTINRLEIGRISPITSLLFILICTSIWGQVRVKRDVFTFVGCYSSLAVFFISSVILIGYLYKAPLLYGSKIIPVSLPSGINFFLFSITLIRFYDCHIWKFNDKYLDNQYTKQLILSFLPVIIFLIVIEGYLDARVMIHNINPPLKSALNMIVIVSVTIFLILRISAVIGETIQNDKRKLKEDEMKFRTVADHTYAWEFWLNNDFRFIYNSPSCERISGYKPKDFIEDPDLMTRIIHPEDLSIYKNHASGRNIEKNCSGINYRIFTSSGEIRWVEHICQPVFNEEGEITGRRGSIRDITTRMNDEIKIRELNKKLALMNSDKDRFISILGHDLKSPFSNILGITEVLKQELHGLSQIEVEELVNNLNKSAKLTFNLLEDILMLTTSQQGKLPFDPQRLNIAQFFESIIDILNPTAFAKNITIHYSFNENIEVYADPYMLKIILLNLVTNAVKFSNTDGRIDLNATENNNEIMITVSDVGVGISPDNITRLFDISQVISTRGTNNEKGTGLGLIICKDFVEKHSGKIWVESEVNKGSDFKFTLPLS